MTDPYLSEIRLMAFGFPPKGWAPCDGQLLPIRQNQALFSLLGTTYGGDGRTSFGLPDLRDRVPMGSSSANPVGTVVGAPVPGVGAAGSPPGSEPAESGGSAQPYLTLSLCIAIDGFFPPRD